MTYDDQLKTDEWQKVRDRIILRDNGECQLCMRKEFLRVHHKQYLFGKKAWEYDDRFLITLCAFCHAKFHDKEKSPVLEPIQYPSQKIDIVELSKKTAYSVSTAWKLRVRETSKFIEDAQKIH